MKIRIFLLLIVLTSNPTNDLLAKCNPKNISNHLLFSKNITFTRVVESSSIGKIHNKTIIKDNKSYQDSIQYYNNKQMEKSLSIIKQLYKKYPKDLFIMAQYAKVTYMMKDKSDISYKLYKKIVKEINSYGSEELSSITKKPSNINDETIVNSTFIEVYWKLGCLHLDYGKWHDAYIELSKVMAILLHNPAIKKGNPIVYTTCINYLTECTFHLKLKNQNNYFYCLYKKLDRKNKFIDKYLLK